MLILAAVVLLPIFISANDKGKEKGSLEKAVDKESAIFKDKESNPNVTIPDNKKEDNRGIIVPLGIAEPYRFMGYSGGSGGGGGGNG